MEIGICKLYLPLNFGVIITEFLVREGLFRSVSSVFTFLCCSLGGRQAGAMGRVRQEFFFTAGLPTTRSTSFKTKWQGTMSAQNVEQKSITREATRRGKDNF